MAFDRAVLLLMSKILLTFRHKIFKYLAVGSQLLSSIFFSNFDLLRHIGLRTRSLSLRFLADTPVSIIVLLFIINLLSIKNSLGLSSFDTKSVLS